MRLPVLLFVILLTIASNCWAQENIIDRIQQLKSGIVTVETELVKIINVPHSKDRRTATYTRQAAGIIIDPSGFIVTNTHTIINAPIVWVILANGKKYPAHVLAANLDYDFSILKINTETPLTSIELANSDSAQISEPIIAVGNSEFNQDSLLSGQINALIKNESSGHVEFIEVNLSLYRGDSGGPVFDHNGRLLGIVMAKHKSNDQRAVIIAVNKIRDQYWRCRKNLSR